MPAQTIEAYVVVVLKRGSWWSESILAPLPGRLLANVTNDGHRRGKGYQIMQQAGV
jgi:hypothetical protein